MSGVSRGPCLRRNWIFLDIFWQFSIKRCHWWSWHAKKLLARPLSDEGRRGFRVMQWQNWNFVVVDNELVMLLWWAYDEGFEDEVYLTTHIVEGWRGSKGRAASTETFWQLPPLHQKAHINSIWLLQSQKVRSKLQIAWRQHSFVYVSSFLLTPLFLDLHWHFCCFSSSSSFSPPWKTSTDLKMSTDGFRLSRQRIVSSLVWVQTSPLWKVQIEKTAMGCLKSWTMSQSLFFFFSSESNPNSLSEKLTLVWEKKLIKL